MDLASHFQSLARYNRLANEQLYESCAQLSDAEYRLQRKGSFGSIHALLNHVLLGDRIWMSRFEGGGGTTPPLNTVLFEDFNELRAARARQDAAIENFFGGIDQEFFARELKYVNSKGTARNDSPLLAVPHFFNHQTHHRGQVHVMLSQTDVKPPALDMHWLLTP